MTEEEITKLPPGTLVMDGNNLLMRGDDDPAAWILLMSLINFRVGRTYNNSITTISQEGIVVGDMRNISKNMEHLLIKYFILYKHTL